LTGFVPITKVAGTSMWLTILFDCIAAGFALMTAGALFHLRWVRRLPSRSSTSPGSPPRVSVVLAARDEQARIENTVRRLLAQQDVSVEVIVVDDRSTDATGAILKRLADGDARVKPRRVDTLPEGWLGKCHACHLGASAATGDWILFTDADCWLKPDVLARTVARAEQEEVEHVTLTPGIAPQTAGAAAWHLIFLMSLANWISGVNRDRPQSHLGMGAFNFVRTRAYRASDGYEALRMTVLDDVKFGLVLRRAGHRTRAFLGGDDVECHWGKTLRDMIQIMEKNYFAALEYRTSAAFVLGLGAPLVWLGAVLGPFTGTPAGIAAGIALGSMIWPASLLAGRLGWPWRYAALAPVVFPTLFYAALKSAVVTLKQGGVRWRDTFYPLDRLRAGTLR
jgi:glycosyltransferase involved in cell wall biosynthesis